MEHEMQLILTSQLMKNDKLSSFKPNKMSLGRITADIAVTNEKI